jgi:hypothetical protein
LAKIAENCDHNIDSRYFLQGALVRFKHTSGPNAVILQQPHPINALEFLYNNVARSLHKRDFNADFYCEANAMTVTQHHHGLVLFHEVKINFYKKLD